MMYDWSDEDLLISMASAGPKFSVQNMKIEIKESVLFSFLVFSSLSKQ